MRSLLAVLFTITLALPTTGLGIEAGALKDYDRIISVGGAVTETIVALGFGDRIVGVDTSSTFPEDVVAELPKVGYARQLSAEGLLSLEPEAIVLTADAGPEDVLAQLKSTGIPMFTVPSEKTIEAAQTRISYLAEGFGAKEKGDSLTSDIVRDIEKAEQFHQENTPSILFIYARGAKMVMASGTGTEADAMIALAGGKNAMSGYADYRPVSAEGVISANPDVILMMSKGAESLGEDGVWSIPGIQATTAGQNKNLIVMDDLYLLGFGPRTGDAVLELSQKLAEVSK